jgi:hypothetical protein
VAAVEVVVIATDAVVAAGSAISTPKIAAKSSSYFRSSGIFCWLLHRGLVS